MKNVLVYYDDVTLGYNTNRSSLFEENKKLREELAKVTKERDMFARDAMEFAITLREEYDTNDE